MRLKTRCNHLTCKVIANKCINFRERVEVVGRNKNRLFRVGSRTASTSKMEHFVIIVNGWKSLTIITKSSILDVAAVLDPPLLLSHESLVYVKEKLRIKNKNLTNHVFVESRY